MKVRESGMPPLDEWEAFFHPEQVLADLGLTSACADVVEFGCGYGTFTRVAAARINGTVHALDIDPEMLAVAQARARAERIPNIRFYHRDFMADGSGLPEAFADCVLMFNILHCEQPEHLLREAGRNLVAGGNLAIMHWNPDEDTPRGPPLAIRPRPEECREWAEAIGFISLGETQHLHPYHYGMTLLKP